MNNPICANQHSPEPMRKVGQTKSQIVYRCWCGREERRAKPGSNPKSLVRYERRIR